MVRLGEGRPKLWDDIPEHQPSRQKTTAKTRKKPQVFDPDTVELDWRAYANERKFDREVSEKYGSYSEFINHPYVKPAVQYLESFEDRVSWELFTGDPLLPTTTCIILLFMVSKRLSKTACIFLAAFLYSVNPILVVVGMLTFWKEPNVSARPPLQHSKIVGSLTDEAEEKGVREKNYGSANNRAKPRSLLRSENQAALLALQSPSSSSGTAAAAAPIDHILIGNSISTLYTAALLSRNGHKCCVLQLEGVDNMKINVGQAPFPVYLHDLSLSKAEKYQKLLDTVQPLTGNGRVTFAPIGTEKDGYTSALLSCRRHEKSSCKNSHAKAKVGKDEAAASDILVALRSGELSFANDLARHLPVHRQVVQYVSAQLRKSLLGVSSFLMSRIVVNVDKTKESRVKVAPPVEAGASTTVDDGGDDAVSTGSGESTTFVDRDRKLLATATKGLSESFFATATVSLLYVLEKSQLISKAFNSHTNLSDADATFGEVDSTGTGNEISPSPATIMHSKRTEAYTSTKSSSNRRTSVGSEGGSNSSSSSSKSSGRAKSKKAPTYAELKAVASGAVITPVPSISDSDSDKNNDEDHDKRTKFKGKELDDEVKKKEKGKEGEFDFASTGTSVAEIQRRRLHLRQLEQRLFSDVLCGMAVLGAGEALPASQLSAVALANAVGDAASGRYSLVSDSCSESPTGEGVDPYEALESMLIGVVNRAGGSVFSDVLLSEVTMAASASATTADGEENGSQESATFTPEKKKSRCEYIPMAASGVKVILRRPAPDSSGSGATGAVVPNAAISKDDMVCELTADRSVVSGLGVLGTYVNIIPATAVSPFTREQLGGTGQGVRDSGDSKKGRWRLREAKPKVRVVYWFTAPASGRKMEDDDVGGAVHQQQEEELLSPSDYYQLVCTEDLSSDFTDSNADVTDKTVSSTTADTVAASDKASSCADTAAAHTNVHKKAAADDDDDGNDDDNDDETIVDEFAATSQYVRVWSPSARDNADNWKLAHPNNEQVLVVEMDAVHPQIESAICTKFNSAAAVDDNDDDDGDDDNNNEKEGEEHVKAIEKRTKCRKDSGPIVYINGSSTATDGEVKDGTINQASLPASGHAKCMSAALAPKEVDSYRRRADQVVGSLYPHLNLAVSSSTTSSGRGDSGSCSSAHEDNIDGNDHARYRTANTLLHVHVEAPSVGNHSLLANTWSKYSSKFSATTDVENLFLCGADLGTVGGGAGGGGGGSLAGELQGGWVAANAVLGYSLKDVLSGRSLTSDLQAFVLENEVEHIA